MWKRSLRWGGAALVLLILAAWGLGELTYPRDNPPQRYHGTILSAQSDATLRGACFDCHSNETRHPWYVRLPIAGLIMGQNVRRGRAELNFSAWATLDPEKRREAISESLEKMQGGKMPPWDYALLHPEARLSAEQYAQLEADAMRAYGVRAGEGGGEGGEDEAHERGERD